jgi:hypothetical protein
MAMNKDILKFAVKLFVGMVALATGSTLVKKAGEDAGRIKLKN